MFLGDEWVKKYVGPRSAKKKSMFTLVDHPSADKHRAVTNYFRLAENLYNLQFISGFDECLERLRDGDIDGVSAELEFGGMLFRNRVSFRYVVPRKILGCDYDVEIFHPRGIKICADAKNKIDTTAFSRRTVEASLSEARKQLPKDMPGMIFIKIPDAWTSINNWRKELGDIARKFMRQHPTIVSIKYYIIVRATSHQRVTVNLGYMELSNDKTDFGNDIDWDIFRQEWSGKPTWWQPIMWYPTGKETR